MSKAERVGKVTTSIFRHSCSTFSSRDYDNRNPILRRCRFRARREYPPKYPRDTKGRSKIQHKSLGKGDGGGWRLFRLRGGWGWSGGCSKTTKTSYVFLGRLPKDPYQGRSRYTTVRRRRKPSVVHTCLRSLMFR